MACTNVPPSRRSRVSIAWNVSSLRTTSRRAGKSPKLDDGLPVCSRLCSWRSLRRRSLDRSFPFGFLCPEFSKRRDFNPLAIRTTTAILLKPVHQTITDLGNHPLLQRIRNHRFENEGSSRARGDSRKSDQSPTRRIDEATKLKPRCDDSL